MTYKNAGLKNWMQNTSPLNALHNRANAAIANVQNPRVRSALSTAIQPVTSALGVDHHLSQRVGLVPKRAPAVTHTETLNHSDLPPDVLARLHGRGSDDALAEFGL